MAGKRNRWSGGERKAWLKFVCCLALVSLLLGACNLGVSEIGQGSASSSGGAVAWLDQPASDATLPLAPFPLKAHATKPGGGITAIVFFVNDVPVGTVNTSANDTLVNAEFNWNPVAPGWYTIQAHALSGGGTARSGVARLCIVSSSADANACGVAPQVSETPSPTPPLTETPTLTPTPGEITFRLDASPSPVYAGQCTNGEATSLNISAVPSDVKDAVEVTARTWIENASGSRQELAPQAMQNDGSGKYSVQVDLSGVDIQALNGEAGRLVYSVSLMNDKKEFYAVSAEEAVVLIPCVATPVPITISMAASPDPVYAGACTQGEPQLAAFKGVPSDMSGVAAASIRVWLQNHSGWRFELMNQAMTQTGSAFTSSLDVSQVDVKMLENRTGRLVYVMSLKNAAQEVILTSKEYAIRLQPCETPTEVSPQQDTTPPTISGGGTAGTLYFDPKKIGCTPVSAKISVNVSDPSGLQYVLMYWYWAGSGNANSAQYVQMSGSGSAYTYKFVPDRGGDKFMYWFKAADAYGNVQQTGMFSVAVLDCARKPPSNIITPKPPTNIITPIPQITLVVPLIRVKTPTPIIIK